MNVGQLLTHFDRISEAPETVARLRRFILDLAVRGKLVEQDPDDEPASDLLKRIQTEKARLVKEGEIRSPRVLEASDEENEIFPLPTLWAWCRLSEVGAIVGGGTPPSADADNFTNGGSGTAWLTPADLGKHTGLYVSHGARDLTPQGLRSSSATLMPKGSVLFTSRAPIGYTAIAANKVSTNQGFKSVVPFIPACNLYIAVYFRAFGKWIDGKASGTTFREVSGKIVASVPFPLPPLAEQNRIVAKVDEMMALCDRLEAAQGERENRRDRLVAASLHRLNNGADVETFREYTRFHLHHLPRLTTRPEHIQQLRQTILNITVRGKLVPQDPNDEPASELLKRIQAENARLVKEGTIKRLQPVLPIDVAEFPAAVPDGWQWVRVSDLLLGDSQNGYSKKPDDALDGIPILRISAGTVRKDGVVAEEEHKLIGGVSAAQQEQYQLQPGDLLACRFNGNRRFVGRLSLYLGYLGIKPIYPDKLIRLRLLSQFVLPGLVRCFTESSAIRRDIEGYCATTVGNWGISASNLKDVKIPLPPIAEQHRIVAKVNELMALCDRLEAQLTITAFTRHQLLEATIDQAISGEIELQQSARR